MADGTLRIPPDPFRVIVRDAILDARAANPPVVFHASDGSTYTTNAQDIREEAGNTIFTTTTTGETVILRTTAIVSVSIGAVPPVG